MLILAGSPIVRAAQTGTETAAAIVQKMLKAYAEVSSYEDEGVTLSYDPDKAEPNEIVFATFFRRADYFRFEWTSHHPYPPLRHLKTYAVTWSDAAGVHTFRQPPNSTSTLRDDGNMSRAIAGATGVSRGSAHHVLRLLSTGVGGFAINELESLAVVGTDKIEGTSCYQLAGKHPRGNLYQVWVGTTDYLIRRIRRPNSASGNDQEETRRNIRINHPIPDAIFDPLRAKRTM